MSKTGAPLYDPTFDDSNNDKSEITPSARKSRCHQHLPLHKAKLIIILCLKIRHFKLPHQIEVL